jgi:hypothetical protein
MNTFKIKRRNSSSKHSLILITIVLRNKLRPIRHIEIFTDFDSGFIEWLLKDKEKIGMIKTMEGIYL